jgi:dihydrolipoamide dehydrogenase
VSPTPYDVALIGAGPAGYVGAIRAAQLGARVALVERDALGGTCLNRGCIPSKALISCVEALTAAKDASAFGVEVTVGGMDLDRMRRHMERCVKQLVSGVEGLMKKNGVTVVRGHGTLRSSGEVEVRAADGAATSVAARKTILATGSAPLRLPIPGGDLPGILTSDDALRLESVPESIAIIGGGAIGLEWAFIYAGLGSAVTVLEMLPTILPTEDEEITAELARALKKRGLKIVTGAACRAIEAADGGFRVVYEQDGQELSVSAQQVMMAAGRRAVTEELGLDAVGVETERRCIRVNDRFETSVADVYAVGDCLRGIGLAHQASHEAIAAVENALGGHGHVNYDAVPACVFTWPEVASVGLKERQAQERGLAVTVGRFPFRANGKSIAAGEREGFVKLIADAASGRLLGGAILGPEASSLIAEVTLAVHHELTAEDVAQTIHAHPTLAEVVGEAALAAAGRALHL